MVCIYVQASAGELPIWSIIELQGVIERLVEADTPDGSIDLGSLCQSAHNPTVVHLMLGSHQLEGKVVALKKPLALLDFQATNGADAADNGSRQCKVVSVIREKVIFKTRPKPIISKPGTEPQPAG